MPSTKPLFFKCFLACRSGPETRNFHHILTIYPTFTLPKHAWNTILLTKSLDSEAWKPWFANPTIQLFNIMIRNDETRCCRRNHSFFNAFWRASVGLKREAHQIPIFYYACTLPKHAWNTMPSTRSSFLTTFWHAAIRLKREALSKFSQYITCAPC